MKQVNKELFRNCYLKITKESLPWINKARQMYNKELFYKIELKKDKINLNITFDDDDNNLQYTILKNSYKEISLKEFIDIFFDIYTIEEIKEQKISIEIDNENQYNILRDIQKSPQPYYSHKKFIRIYDVDVDLGNFGFATSSYLDAHNNIKSSKEIHFYQINFNNKQENMENKTIIGYKLIKPEYEQIVYNIGDTGLPLSLGNNTKCYYSKHGYLPLCANHSIKKLREAGVLDLWFEPVYKNFYKIGDWILTSNNAAGWGSSSDNVNNKILKITSIDLSYSPNNGGRYCFNGVKTVGKEIVRFATNEEIKHHLINLATEKGFVYGKEFKSFRSMQKGEAVDENYRLENEGDYNGTVGSKFYYNENTDTLVNYGFGAYVIYEKGQWAEVIEEVIFKMGQFNLKITGKKVYHNNEDITQFVKTLVEKFVINSNIGNYNCNIEEIIFSKTGCRNTTTKLSDWRKVYDMIK